MKLSTLYKRATTGKITEWTIEVEGNKFRTIAGFTDGKKTTSAWTECFGKNVGKKNGTSPEQQALAEATATHRKRIEQGSFENINDIDNETFYKPMLAQKLEDRIKKLTYPVLSQPKLDGVRCIAKVSGLWTREGKRLLAAPHIFEELQPLFEDNPDLILDGELYCDKLANDFNKIISLVRKQKPTPEQLAESKGIIKYFVYDYPSFDGNFVARSKALSLLNLPQSCELVKTFVLSTKEDIQLQFDLYMSQGYEGQMIRLDLPYENKRSNSLLKHKEFDETEGIVEAVIEGKGNMAGKVGKVLLRAENGLPFEAPINGDWEYLTKLFNEGKLVSKPVTYRHFKLTPAGIPRFPKVIAVRDYE
jgi:DNA ligase-1